MDSILIMRSPLRPYYETSLYLTDSVGVDSIVSFHNNFERYVTDKGLRKDILYRPTHKNIDKALEPFCGFTFTLQTEWDDTIYIEF